MLERLKPPLTLPQAIAVDEQQSREADWYPSYWGGGYGIEPGWYIQRHSNGVNREWLRDADQKLIVCDSEADALALITQNAASEESA